MPEKLVLDNFAQGLRTEVDVLDVPLGAASDCANVVFDRNTIKVRHGLFQSNPTMPGGAAAGRGLRCMHQWAGQGAYPTRLVGTIGNQVWATTNATQTYNGSEVALASTVHATNRTRFAELGTNLYRVDGSGPVRRVAMATLGVSTPAESVPLTPSGAVAAAAAGYKPLDEGTHEFACRFTGPAGTPTYPLSGVLSVYCAKDAVDNISVTYHNPPGGAYQQTELYARGAWSSGEWVLIATAPTDPNPCVYTQTVTTAVNPLLSDPCPGIPPSACAIVIGWDGRVIFTKGDTAYVSVRGDGDGITSSAISPPPDDWGWETQVGSDGQDITGVGILGGRPVFFKQTGIWVMMGNSPNAFSLEQVESGHGCLVHESIAAAPEGLIYLSDDGFRILPLGGAAQDLGYPVHGALFEESGTTLTLNQAYAAYNAKERTYTCTWPAVGGNPAIAFRYDFRKQNWARFTGYNGGPLIYAPRFYYPGMHGGQDVSAAHEFWLDDAAKDNGLPIGWSWQSGRIDPWPGYFKDILRVTVTALGTGSTNPLYCGIRVNGYGESTGLYNAQQELFPTSTEGSRQTYAWEPPAIQDASDFKVILWGNSESAFEIVRIVVTVANGGAIV